MVYRMDLQLDLPPCFSFVGGGTWMTTISFLTATFFRRRMYKRHVQKRLLLLL
jgi:hypothetical protein